jgi:hypothetical protein
VTQPPEEKPGRGPLFVERQTYRRRRMMDAARFLPIVGCFLWLIPLLWSQSAEESVSASNANTYVFAIWVLLILSALFIAIPLRPVEDPEQTGKDKK